MAANTFNLQAIQDIYSYAIVAPVVPENKLGAWFIHYYTHAGAWVAAEQLPCEYDARQYAKVHNQRMFRNFPNCKRWR